MMTTLLEFVEYFPTEASCREFLKEHRETAGVTCRKCRGGSHYWCSGIEKWSCRSCGYQTSLKSGTVMEGSNLPIRKWFMCMHLMVGTKKGISALEMQRQLKHSRYEPVWRMMQKIRQAMGGRDSQYALSGSIELDDGFFEQVIMDREERQNIKDEGLKRGKGSQRQAKVLVMVGSEDVPEDQRTKYGKHKKCNYIKMKVVEDLTQETVNAEVSDALAEGSSAETDDAKSFAGLNKVVSEHKIHNMSLPGVDPGKALPWVHTAISNAKRNMLGVYHMISDKYMQSYLDEFAYKFNRKYFADMFTRIFTACVAHDKARIPALVKGG